jgi:hypothetical protein
MSKKVSNDYLQAMGEVVSLEDWRDIVRQAVQDASDGDAKAREWLSKYLLGKSTLPASTLGNLLQEINEQEHTWTPVILDN